MWKGYDPEFPVLECAGSHIVIEHLFDVYVVARLGGGFHPCSRQLFLILSTTHKSATFYFMQTSQNWL